MNIPNVNQRMIAPRTIAIQKCVENAQPWYDRERSCCKALCAWHVKLLLVFPGELIQLPRGNGSVVASE